MGLVGRLTRKNVRRSAVDYPDRNGRSLSGFGPCGGHEKTAPRQNRTLHGGLKVVVGLAKVIHNSRSVRSSVPSGQDLCRIGNVRVEGGVDGALIETLGTAILGENAVVGGPEPAI